MNLSVSSSTVVSNLANGSGFDFGGGIYDLGSATPVLNSTIVGDQDTYGGGFEVGGSAPIAGNTILAGNIATVGVNAGAEVSGSLSSSDYNLIQNTSGFTLMGTTTHCILNQSPLLGPLRVNGGPTYTLALLPGSPAIDKGYSFRVATDQRGRPRPYDFPAIANAGVGGGSDIGAFELIPSMLSIAHGSGNNVIVSWPTADGGYSLESNTNLSMSASWTVLSGTPAVVSGRYTVTSSAAGTVNAYRLKSM